ncbi:PAS domain-containing protein [Actinomyces sp. 2119]|uniref:PAS domain-containing protein n=1 Tax=Actinomyces sp. 2119 TaxID=2321393 RepID=UPI002175F03F|nr:PAS domain-containing protein [Actinomyces sp. 2119]
MSVVHKVKATGAIHEVGVDQLFFSTTDSRGLIRHSNNVFIELSRYTREELSGAPHNIVRHPEMPGGVFREMWDALKEGHPFAGYVRNLAADGSQYDVFATVTPLPDGGYLSVRTRPVCTDFFETACSIYREARQVEDQALAQGDSRRLAAQKGAQRIGDLLKQVGMPSYEDFQNTALPAEVARREELSAGLPQRPGADGELGTMLEAVTAVVSGLDSWMGAQDELVELSSALRAAGQGLRETLDDPLLTEHAVSELDRSDPRVRPLADLIDLWVQMQGIVGPVVERLADTLVRLDTNSARTRFRVALARLHATTTLMLVAEIIDGVGDTQASSQGVPDLIESLAQGLTEMEQQAQEHRALAEQVASDIGEVSRMMTIPHQLLMLWTGSASPRDPDLPAKATALSDAASQAVESVGRRLAELDGAAARCQRAAAPADSLGLPAQLERLRVAAKVASL